MLNHFVLSLISASLVAQTTSSVPPKKTGIPNRPEKLSFRSIDFKVPNVRVSANSTCKWIKLLSRARSYRSTHY